MKRLVFAAATMMLGMATGVQAQLPYQRPMTNPYYRPPVNPILNTLGPLRGGVGYYTQTRPQIDASRAIGQLQQGQLMQGQQLAGLQAAGAVGVPSVQGITGHPVAFFNYSHYYTFPSPRFPSPSSPITSAGNLPASSPLQDPSFGRAPQGPGIGIFIGTSVRDD